MPKTALPVLAGCHPDPSVCRVGEEYFLVTSTFAYHPGLPVHRSGDLRSWELIGHVLVDDDRRLDGLDVSDGVWAPTIRFHRGLFYVIWGEARDRRWSQTYVSTASDPAGPWSAPVALDAEGIDPSLFFDDDGRCWFTAARDADDPAGTGPAELWMREFDYRAMRLVGPSYPLWHGAVRGAWVEAPHVYKHDGRYHLVGAEGGTERNHAVTAAQADTVTGPYRTDPRSPLLTHRHLGETMPVQNVGHVDVVDTADGGIAALALAVRPIDGHHVLGREVFLVPARWSAAGLELAPGAGRLEHPGPAVQPAAPDWLSLRGPIGWSSTDDGIGIDAREEPLSGSGRPALIGRRQTDHRFAFEGSAPRPALPGERIGAVAFQHAERWVRASVRLDGDDVLAEIHLRRDGEELLIATALVPPGELRLRIDSDGRRYRLAVLVDGEAAVDGEVPHRLLGSEDAGGFVGVLLGFAHEGPVAAGAAEFRALRYAPGDAAVLPDPAAEAVPAG